MTSIGLPGVDDQPLGPVFLLDHEQAGASFASTTESQKVGFPQKCIQL